MGTSRYHEESEKLLLPTMNSSVYRRLRGPTLAVGTEATSDP